jgi:CDP-diacylglycerol--serine O-phosphatidyltransferase
MVCLTFFVVCGVSRLARFNVTASHFTTIDTAKVSHFEGTPIPTSILIVALLAVMLRSGRVQQDVWLGVLRIGPMLLHPLVLIYVLSGSAMISTVRIPKP